MATSRTGRGRVGEVERALTSSQIGPPNFENRSHGFQGPISAPSLLMAWNPLKLLSMPFRMSSYSFCCSGLREDGERRGRRMAESSASGDQEQTNRGLLFPKPPREAFALIRALNTGVSRDGDGVDLGTPLLPARGG